MWLRPKAGCLHTLALPTVQLRFLERNFLLLAASQESESSFPLTWGHANKQSLQTLLSEDMEGWGWVPA